MVSETNQESEQANSSGGFKPRHRTRKGRNNIAVKVTDARHSQMKSMAKKNNISLDELLRQIIEYALGEETTETD